MRLDSTTLESSCASLIEVLPPLSCLALEKLLIPLGLIFFSKMGQIYYLLHICITSLEQWKKEKKTIFSSKNYFIVIAAAAAKSLQLCPTLCDPIDGSPPGSSVPGILQARTQEWVAISFSNAWKWIVKVKLLSRVHSSRPHGLQPTRLLRPWDFPGKSTGVGCHCLIVIMITLLLLFFTLPSPPLIPGNFEHSQ